MMSHYSILIASFAFFLPFLDAARPVNIQGAFYSSGQRLYLFNDQHEVLAVRLDGTSAEYTLIDFGAPANFDLTAASFETNPFGMPRFILFGDEKIYDGVVLNYDGDFDAHSGRFPDFLWHSIDAATNGGTVKYCFKGCNYISFDGLRWNTNVRDVSDLNIPCHVDAAWNDGIDSYVLKGNRVWIVGGDNQSMALDDYRPQDKWDII